MEIKTDFITVECFEEIELNFVDTVVEDEVEEVLPFLKFIQSDMDTLETDHSLFENENESEDTFAFFELLTSSR